VIIVTTYQTDIRITFECPAATNVKTLNITWPNIISSQQSCWGCFQDPLSQPALSTAWFESLLWGWLSLLMQKHYVRCPWRLLKFHAVVRQWVPTSLRLQLPPLELAPFHLAPGAPLLCEFGHPGLWITNLHTLSCTGRLTMVCFDSVLLLYWSCVLANRHPLVLTIPWQYHYGHGRVELCIVQWHDCGWDGHVPVQLQ
jgi:hypothetical protein